MGRTGTGWKESEKPASGPGDGLGGGREVMEKGQEWKSTGRGEKCLSQDSWWTCLGWEGRKVCRCVKGREPWPAARCRDCGALAGAWNWMPHALPPGSVVKESACSAGDAVSVPGSLAVVMGSVAVVWSLVAPQHVGSFQTRD